MISLVVCSVNPHYLAQLQANINGNIGVEHEWLVCDNRVARLGLSEAYNKMAEQAKFPYICFLHEDLLINTNAWGTLLIDICRQQQVSLIGVAGGKYKSNFFSGWYSGGNSMDFYSLVHRVNGIEEKMVAPHEWKSNEEEVASIDGVFMFCTADAWRTNRFNQDLLKGFHYYDIDFSLRVAMRGKVMVTNRLQLVHFSKGGDFGSKWIRETILWHKNLEKSLPFAVASEVDKDIDMKVARYWLDWLKNMSLTWRDKMDWIDIQQLYKYPGLWYGIAKFILYQPLKLKKIHHLIIGKNKG